LNKCGVRFDVVLLNYYRDGKDIISWHSDREAKGTPVASLSLGESRHFRMKLANPATPTTESVAPPFVSTAATSSS
jgi:alkylated DNA repair dioxygenase AlkB